MLNSAKPQDDDISDDYDDDFSVEVSDKIAAAKATEEKKKAELLVMEGAKPFEKDNRVGLAGAADADDDDNWDDLDDLFDKDDNNNKKPS